MPHYGTIEGFRAYTAARGVLVDTSDDEDVETSLLVASEWLDNVYRTSFSGLKVGGRDQIREWPRTNVVDIYGYPVPSDSVPREVENATYEAAIRQLANPGSLSVDWTPGRYKRASVDGAVSVEYAQFNYAIDLQPQFAIIDQILAPLLMGDGGNFSGLSGAISRV